MAPSYGHILCVASNYPRWQGDSATPFVHNLAVDLINLGWRVTVLAPHAPGCRKAEVLDGVPVKRFRYLWPDALQTICYQGGMLVNLRRRPLGVLKVPVFLLAETWRVARELRHGQYDLVHSHCIVPQGLACSLACCQAPHPHVITVHGSDIFSLNAPPLRPVKRFALRHATAVTVNSSVTRKALLDLEPPASAITHLIPMGANLPPSFATECAAQQASASEAGRSCPTLLFVGRVIEEKGVRDLLQAMPIICRELPSATLMLVGEGQDRPAFEALARELGIGNRVIFSGWMTTDELVRAYRGADIFIGPSHPPASGGGEAQGLVFAEAMLAGTPVIATEVGGIVDAVIHEETGLLVPPHAPEAIAAAVIRLWREPDLRQRLREQARRLACERFTRQASAQAFSRLFQRLLARGQPS